MKANELLLSLRKLDILHYFWRFKDEALLIDLMSLSVTFVLLLVYKVWPGRLSRHAQWLFLKYVKSGRCLECQDFHQNPADRMLSDIRRVVSSPSSATALVGT